MNILNYLLEFNQFIKAEHNNNIMVLRDAKTFRIPNEVVLFYIWIAKRLGDHEILIQFSILLHIELESLGVLSEWLEHWQEHLSWNVSDDEMLDLSLILYAFGSDWVILKTCE